MQLATLDPAVSAPRRARVPFTAVAVLGFGSLVALGVGLTLYLGITTVTENTRRLLSEQSDQLIESVVGDIETHLRPVVSQGRWVADYIERGEVSLDDRESLDHFVNGALAATPQVAGIVIVTPDGMARRWARGESRPVVEDWSGRAEIRGWIEDGRNQRQAAWREPVWAESLNQAVVLHDVPLHRDGMYLGILGQVIPVTELSHRLGTLYSDTGMTPFVLYGRNRVLAHPLMIEWTPLGTLDENAPLPTISDIGDGVLEQIWSPDLEQPFFLRPLLTAEASAVLLGGRYYVFLYRHIEGYGPIPWTIGVYLNTELIDSGEIQRIVVMAASGGLLLILCLAATIVTGRFLSRRIIELAAAARIARSERFDEVPTLARSLIREVDEATESFNQMVDGLRERDLIRNTLGRFVPREVADNLLSDGGQIEPREVVATVLFCDLESFTQLTESLGPVRTVAVLNAFFSAMVAILERHRGVVTQFQGDAILATFNVPITNPAHANAAVGAALEMLDTVGAQVFAGERLRIRIGINTGPLVAGAVGAEGRLSYTVHGDAVNLAARLESLNKEYDTRILLSAATASTVDGFELHAVGEAVVRGQSSRIKLYEARNS